MNGLIMVPVCMVLDDKCRDRDDRENAASVSHGESGARFTSGEGHSSPTQPDLHLLSVCAGNVRHRRISALATAER